MDFHLILNDKKYTGKTRNISLSGVFLLAPEPALTPCCISQLADLNVKHNDEWLSFKCEIVFIANQDNGVFPAGAGAVFCDTHHETGSSILNLADIITNILNNELPSQNKTNDPN